MTNLESLTDQKNALESKIEQWQLEAENAEYFAIQYEALLIDAEASENAREIAKYEPLYDKFDKETIYWNSVITRATEMLDALETAINCSIELNRLLGN